MQIEMLSTRELIPYINNPRNNEKAVDYVANSIKEFGFKVPIVVDKNNVIVAGHTRLLASEKLGLDEVPVIRANDLTEEQVRAYRLADNKTAEASEWDLDLLQGELENIELNMEQFGFEVDNQIIDGLEEPEEEVKETFTPEAQRGQVWQLGEHRLMCGDSTSQKELEKLMNGEQADALITDPPYNVDYSEKEQFMLGYRTNNRTTAGQNVGIENDTMDDGEFLSFLTDTFSASRDVLKAGGAFYIWHSDATGHVFRNALAEAGLTYRQVLIWAKSQFALSRQDYHWQHEPCLYGWKDGAGHYFTDDRTQTNVFDDVPNYKKMNKEELVMYIQELLDAQPPATVIREDKPLRSELHPTMKPIKLIAKLIANSTQADEIVLDTFGGSGTTLMASEQLGRKCYTMELEPKYVDVIIKRWEEQTGEEAVLIE